jgi:lipoate-protein ligase A
MVGPMIHSRPGPDKGIPGNRMPWPLLNYLEATLPTIAENLALDEALLLAAEDLGGPSVLRIWELDHLAVVLGASGRMAEDVRSEACLADGVAIARRSSGGGTVVIGPGALNFSVVLPIDSAPELKSVDDAQRFVLERTAREIRLEGPAVELLGSGDLTLGRRKFSGSAQRRLRRHVLIHASLLYDFPIDRIDRYTRIPSRKPDYREGRPHAEFVMNLPMPRERLLAALKSAWLVSERDPAPATIPEDLVRGLVETKFSSYRWIGRL